MCDGWSEETVEECEWHCRQKVFDCDQVCLCGFGDSCDRFLVDSNILSGVGLGRKVQAIGVFPDANL